jgi:hypothetical protein
MSVIEQVARVARDAKDVTHYIYDHTMMQLISI